MNLSSLPSLEHLRQELAQLPGMGPKAAFRLALHFLRLPHARAEHLIRSIVEAREHLHLCVQCNGFVEGEGECYICTDTTRNRQVICMVEDPVIPLILESKQKAHWHYYVTHGLVSPLEGRHPEDLPLEKLWERLPYVQEIILAFSTSMEGETTAMYVMDEIHKKAPHVQLSRIAYGVPFGARLDGLDQRTLWQALQFRQPALSP